MYMTLQSQQVVGSQTETAAVCLNRQQKVGSGSPLPFPPKKTMETMNLTPLKKYYILNQN